MKLPRLAIRNYQFTLVMFLLAGILGLASFFTMPRSEDPQFSLAIVRVVAVMPGAAPEDLESLVVEPLEEELNEMKDLKRIEASIEDGVAVILVEFLTGTDPQESSDRVTQAVARAQGRLPDEVMSIETVPASFADVTILQVALVSETASYRVLGREAERLERVLERVPGIKQADAWAYPASEVRVSLDLRRIGEIGIPFNRVISAIQTSAANIPGGSVAAGSRRFNIQTSGGYESLEDIRRTIIHSSEEHLVYLKDVADVDFAFKDETYRARYRGGRAVFVTVTQREGSNIFQVSKGLKAALAGFSTSLPPGVVLETVFDQSESVRVRVNGFFRSLLQGIVLVGLVILLALGLRASLIVMTAIPLSILIAISWVDFTGHGLQQISIVGLVIALGLLVDNAIVVTENVARHMGEGLEREAAAIKGTGEVGWAVISATATTVLAFLPMVMVQSNSGLYIRSLPVTVICALVASLAVSLTLTPLLASRFLHRSQGKRTLRFFRRRRHAEAGDGAAEAGDKAAEAGDGAATPGSGEPRPSAPLVPVVGPLQRLLRRIVDRYYRHFLAAALARPALVLIVTAFAFAGSLSLFPVIGVSLFPKAEKPQFLINIETPEGTNLDDTDAVTRYVERMLDTYPEVHGYASNIGRGNPRIYYNVYPKREKNTVAQILVELHEADDVPRLAKELQGALDGYVGARFEVYEFENGPPVEAPVAIKVIGPDQAVLMAVAADVERIIRETPGTSFVENALARPKTDLHVQINREKAGMLGVPLAEIDRTVRAGITGLPVASFRDREGESYDIVIRLPLSGRPTLSDFDRIVVSSLKGGSIPLPQLATLELKSLATKVDHFNLERAATVTANVAEGFSEFSVTEEVMGRLAAYALPPGYRFFVGGKLEAQEESFGSLLEALLIALLGIVGILVLQFRSFRQPLIILVSIPLAIIGAFPALLITGYTFSFTAFIGLTSLMGIVINNSIILVDYANQLVARGMTVAEAVREAGETRFTPIALTTLTTIGGLIPLTLTRSSLWSPLSWVIIGGLLVSTLLTLVVVPVLYQLLTDRERKLVS